MGLPGFNTLWWGLVIHSYAMNELLCYGHERRSTRCRVHQKLEDGVKEPPAHLSNIKMNAVVRKVATLAVLFVFFGGIGCSPEPIGTNKNASPAANTNAKSAEPSTPAPPAA